MIGISASRVVASPLGALVVWFSHQSSPLSAITTIIGSGPAFANPTTVMDGLMQEGYFYLRQEDCLGRTVSSTRRVVHKELVETSS